MCSCLWLHFTVTASVFSDASARICPQLCKCPMNVWVCVCVRTHVEVGNILMSTAEQEIGNTFKSLARRTALRSQAESPRRASRVTGRIGGLRFILRAQNSNRERYRPMWGKNRHRLYLLDQLSNSRSSNLAVKEGVGGGRIQEESSTNAITQRAPRRQLWGSAWMTEGLVVRGGYERG